MLPIGRNNLGKQGLFGQVILAEISQMGFVRLTSQCSRRRRSAPPLKGLHWLREHLAPTLRRYDAKETIYGRADHRVAVVGPGQPDDRGVRAELLPLSPDRWGGKRATRPVGVYLTKPPYISQLSSRWARLPMFGISGSRLSGPPSVWW